MSKKSTSGAGGAAIGRPIKVAAKAGPQRFVQVPLQAVEQIGNLLARRPTAGRLLFKMIEYMGPQNAVVISQKTLAKLMGIGLRTVQTAVADLTAERWIQPIKLNGPGTVQAYVINSRVVWAQKREELRLSLFHAAVVADYDDQDPVTLDDAPLRIIPAIFPGERQLPTGPGEDPPSPPFIDGLEPDLPARMKGPGNAT